MSRKKKEKKELGGSDWMATYGDMVTLLLTFFVLLYSMSEVDAKKFEQMASAMNSLLTGTSIEGVLNGNPASSGSSNSPVVGEFEGEVETQATAEQIEELKKTLQAYISDNSLKDVMSVESNTDGVLIKLQDKVLFDSAKYELKPESYEVLGRISTLLVNLNSRIDITGYTDNRPIRNTPGIPHNRRLSMLRADSVADFLEQNGINSLRIEASGKGEADPVGDNNTLEGQAQNRRVEIQVKVGEK